MKKLKAPVAARVLLGLIYFVFGLNFFLQFLPIPPMDGPAGLFLGALFSSGYFFPVLKVTEILGGILLITGFASPLALLILAPVTLQIFLFHSILTPGLQNVVLPLLMVVLHIVSAIGFWHLYAPLFRKQAFCSTAGGKNQ